MTFNPFQERRVRVTVTVTRPDAQGNQEPDIYTFVDNSIGSPIHGTLQLCHLLPEPEQKPSGCALFP